MDNKKIIDLSLRVGYPTIRRFAEFWHGDEEASHGLSIDGLPDIVVTCGWHGSIVLQSIHSGTHVDAPYHRFADGTKLWDIPLEKFLGPAICLDVSPKKSKEWITA
ncbi:MAG TPA: cyclase family protein [Thermoplasmatales archaeon]|nr:cyclase family protein [Thermoplasmatales archaeon]